MRFFSLLHLSDRSASVNSKAIGRRSRKSLYIDNAVNLGKSLAAHGMPYTVLTNDAAAVAAHLRAAGESAAIEVAETAFSQAVPAQLAFYAAHHKIDAFRHLAASSEAYVGLLDLDMTYNGTAAGGLLRDCARAGTPLWYDISDQVHAVYGLDRIRRDMQALDAGATELRWAGGEFVAGPPAFFGALVERVDACWARYIEVSAHLHHQGDEMLVSVALEAMRRNGAYMADAGTTSMVGRYWSGRVRHVQRAAEHHLQNCAFLHLPQDKVFLAQNASLPVSARRHEVWRRRYAWYLRFRLPIKAFNALT